MIFTTTIKAINPLTGILCTWSGQRIEADTWAEAEQYCQANGFGYLEVDGEWIEDIPIERKFDLN